MLVALLVATTQKVSSAPSGADIFQFLQFGVIGLLVVLFMTRKGIVPEWTLRNEERRGAEERAALIEAATNERTELTRRLADKEAQVDRMQEVFEKQTLPALWKSTDVNTRYLEELEQQRIQRETKATARTRRTTQRDADDDDAR